MNILKQALQQDWDRLHPFLRKHYSLRTGTPASDVLTGVMEIDFPAWVQPLLLGGKLFGALINRRGSHIQATVKKYTTADSPYLFWHRSLLFADGFTAHFSSRMHMLHDHEIIEYVRYGLGLRLTLSVTDEGALQMTSNGYLWNLGVITLPLPDWLFLGTAEISERPLADQRFQLDFTLQHPLWGQTYRYSGIFTDIGTDA